MEALLLQHQHFWRGDGSWATPAGAGTVTSVAATVPSIFSISGSPITSSGTLAMTYSGTALPVANGGTGETSYTNGQLLIGNTTGNTLTKATLTAGTGITITNSTGSITIASTGSSATDLLENVQTVTSNYTVTASKNALAVGPITINTGISVTVGTGQKWLILN